MSFRISNDYFIDGRHIIEHIHSIDYYHIEDEHGHKHEYRAHERKKLILASVITGSIFIVEVIGGFITNSLALISDAGHMLTHLFALLVSLFALFFAAKPPTEKKTYGFYRLEILAALFNGITLFVITLWIFYEAYQRFTHPETISSGKMFIVAMMGLIANIGCVYILKGGGDGHEHSLNVRAAFLHMLGDTFSSFGVIIGAIIIYYTNWFIVDPIISVMICVLILIWSYKLIMESVDILLEATPKGINIEEVIASLRQIPGVDDAHDIHVWTITSGMYSMSGHIDTKDMMISETTRLSKEINRILGEKFKIGHAVIQFGCECKINHSHDNHNHS
ncbi:MAG: cation diffusion facilitator family transporter [Candidatus Brocadia sinica]|uniref:Cation efflux system protein CDF family n=1 Tax=Candidatus Brocadia sinica JPN1 TaxID=1197129 RepID=A0ABQ0JU87_9BACT|nr:MULTISPECIES: cation diffusion facilitator family transporter [Brocadia]MCK6469850.1 cation diffusion facilitator family transporter [Candidatus Brocadia sinica]GAN32300.1 cation efflux system protein CDF family [Candidatus Brocadia sinica JPN1]GIK14150.1 MAG: cation transporter [Candidatus Brocadia sinica]GJQ17925.1 MAG: cation transporter [Candidatus Brocadia sinica]